MEAVALYDFSSIEEDELSFKKGSLLKVSDLEKTPTGIWPSRMAEKALFQLIILK